MEKVYCRTNKTVFWIVGYMGGNVKFGKFNEFATLFTEEYGIDKNEIQIREINNSSKYLGSKIMYTNEKINNDKIVNFISVQNFWDFIK